MKGKTNMTRKSRCVRVLMATVVGAGFWSLLSAAPASAQSLEQALVQAYKTNPTLAAQRARLRAVDESIPEAKAGYRPTAKITGSIERQTYDVSPSQGQSTGYAGYPKSAGLTVSQPLYDATVDPSVRKAEAAVQAQRATVVATEESVLLSAATAYLDVVQNQAVLALNSNNVDVLKRQLDAANDRFRVGEYTRTDVALSESRLAGAVAARIQADGNLASSKATYERYVGLKPGTLKAPKPQFKLPKSLDEAVALAQVNNPNIIAASFNERAQEHAITQAIGSLLPSANVSMTAARSWDGVSSSGQFQGHVDSMAITGQVVIPLYQAGLPEARVREAKQTANQYRIQIQDAHNQITESAISAWQSLQTARANIQSYKSQITAAQVALEGNRQEAQVGSKTILDVLDREQELLSARVSLVQAERGEAVAAFTLLSAIGQLTAQQLGLQVEYYDPNKNYEATRNRWTGTGIEE
jgi:TolC family type I secretion outer membrane protein